MRTTAPPTTVSVTPRLSRADVFAAGFTIRWTFSVKFSAAAVELAEEFSKRFLVALPDTPKTDNVARICATTCKLPWKKRLSAQKRKLKFENKISATNAEAPEPSRDHAASPVPFAPVPAKEPALPDFFRLTKPAPRLAAHGAISMTLCAPSAPPAAPANPT